MNSLTPAIKLELKKARDDIDTFHWDRSRKYGTLKDGASFVCPVEANFGLQDIDADETGRYKGTLIIEIRNGKLHDYSVGDWEKITS